MVVYIIHCVINHLLIFVIYDHTSIIPTTDPGNLATMSIAR